MKHVDVQMLLVINVKIHQLIDYQLLHLIYIRRKQKNNFFIFQISNYFCFVHWEQEIMVKCQSIQLLQHQ